MTKILMDSDLICYSVGYATETETSETAVKLMIDEYINRRLTALKSRDVGIYLTDSGNNFRFQIYPEYKQQRKKEKPRWFKQIRQHLIDGWEAEIIDCLEADDAIGIMSTHLGNDCIIVSDDKDLDQLPGHHMKMSTFKQYHVSQESAIKNLYLQWLTGDRIDNIPGIMFVGKTRAEKALQDCKTEQEMKEACELCLKNKSVSIPKVTESNPTHTLWTNRWKHLMCLYLLRTPMQYNMILTESPEYWEEWIKNHEQSSYTRDSQSSGEDRAVTA